MPGLLQTTYPIMRWAFILQSIFAFHNDKVALNYSFFHIVSFTYSSHPIYKHLTLTHFFFLQNYIEIPSFYHQQWAPTYLELAHFKYDGAMFKIRIRQHREKFFFADGLKSFKKDLAIYESTTILFFGLWTKMGIQPPLHPYTRPTIMQQTPTDIQNACLDYWTHTRPAWCPWTPSNGQ